MFDAQEKLALRRRHILNLVDGWKRGEQAKRITETFGKVVASFCRMEVEAIAGRRAPDEGGAILLTRAQVQLCEDRAISSARVAAYGPWALTANDGGDRWKKEYAASRAIVLSGAMPPRLGDAHSEAQAARSGSALQPEKGSGELT